MGIYLLSTNKTRWESQLGRSEEPEDGVIWPKVRGKPLHHFIVFDKNRDNSVQLMSYSLIISRC